MDVKVLDSLRTPVKNTLWCKCLLDEIAECKRLNKKEVDFADVDKRVVDLSHTIIDWEIEDGICKKRNDNNTKN